MDISGFEFDEVEKVFFFFTYFKVEHLAGGVVATVEIGADSALDLFIITGGILAVEGTADVEVNGLEFAVLGLDCLLDIDGLLDGLGLYFLGWVFTVEAFEDLLLQDESLVEGGVQFGSLVFAGVAQVGKGRAGLERGLGIKHSNYRLN